MDEDRPILISGPARVEGLAGFAVPGQTRVLQVTMRGGEGDPDFVLLPPVRGLLESNGIGTTETITAVAPEPGIWAVIVSAPRGYSNVAFTFATPNITELTLDTSRPSLSGVETSETFYSVTVPPGTPNLTVTTSGGSGDVDMFLGLESIPTCQPLLEGPFAPPCEFDEFSIEDGNGEVIHLENPPAGEYFVTLLGFGPYSDTTLSISSLPPGQAPVTELRAVTDGGAFADTVALGGIATAFGVGFGNQEASAGALPLPTEMAGVRVLVNGVPAGLFFVSPIQINFQIPYEITIQGGTVEVVVERDGVATPALSVKAAANAPRFFRFDSLPGVRDPVAINNTASRLGLVTAGNPAGGGDILTLYLTGVSDLINRPASGQGAPGGPLALVTGTVEATIGGAAANVEFAGLAPGFVGLVQINIRLPANLPPGTRLTLRIAVDGASTQPAEISVVVP